MNFKQIVVLCIFNFFSGLKGNGITDSQRGTILRSFITRNFHNSLTFIANAEGLELVSKLEIPKIIYYFDKNLKTKEREEVGVRNSYVIVNNCTENIEFTVQRLLLTKTFRRSSKHLVILTSSLQQNDVISVFTVLWKYYVYNVVVYDLNNDFYTWYPYDAANECGNNVTLKKVMKNEQPFRKKIPRKVHNCTLTIIWPIIPYVSYDPSTKLNTGIVKDVLDMIARQLHLTFVCVEKNTSYIKYYRETNNYEILETHMKMKGIDSAVIERLFYHCDTNDFELDLTKPFVSLPFYLVLPPRAKKPVIIYIVNLFQNVLLVCVIATFLIVSVLLKLISKKPMLEAALSVLRMSLQQSLNDLPVKKAVRTLLTVYLFYNICIYTAWQTSLSTSLTKSWYQPSIRKFEDVAKSNEIIDANKHFMKCSLMNKMGQHIQTILKNVNNIEWIDWFDVKNKFMNNQKNGTVLLNIDIATFKNPEKLEIVTKERVNAAIYTLAIKKGFPLLSKMDYWVRNIHEHGLVKKSMANYVKRKYLIISKDDEKFIKLHLRHLKGAFFILAGGLILSFISFCIELYHIHICFSVKAAVNCLLKLTFDSCQKYFKDAAQEIRRYKREYRTNITF